MFSASACESSLAPIRETGPRQRIRTGNAVPPGCCARSGRKFITSSYHRPIIRKMPVDRQPPQANRVDRRYPIALPLRYSAQRRKTPYAQGTGQTLAIGSASVLFVAGEPLVAGTSVELTLDWPARLAGPSPFAAPYQRQDLPDRRAAGSDAHRRLRMPHRCTLVPSPAICAAIL